MSMFENIVTSGVVWVFLLGPECKRMEEGGHLRN